MKLFSELVGQFDGPILVIGGGPSAPAALEHLKRTGFAPIAVLSANEHGHRQNVFEVTHSVCCDGRHGEKRVPMETLLDVYGKPIITPGHFGDYRLPDWTLSGNTGITAIAAAVFMGGHPVVVVGIDFYRLSSPDVYFHAPDAKSNSTKKNAKNFKAQVDSLVQWVGRRAPVRLTTPWPWDTFPMFDAAEIVAPVPLPPRAIEIRALPTLIVQSRPYPPVSFKLMNVEAGRVFPLSPAEARGFCNNGMCKLIETHPAPGQTTVDLPPNFIRQPRGYVPALLQRQRQRR